MADCRDCANFEECFFSGCLCGRYKKASAGAGADQGKIDRTGEDGFFERPRVPFTVIDF